MPYSTFRAEIPPMTAPRSLNATAITIFTDGACSGNPGPGGWGAIVRVDGEITELGGAANPTTNNRMEMTAVLEALRAIHRHAGAVKLHTDSTYVIQGISGWIHGWKRNGWKTKEGKDVVNRDIWEALSDVVSERTRKHGKDSDIEWIAVPGHSGMPGNERCDEIAVDYSQGLVPALYHGPSAGYRIHLDADVPARAPSKKKSKPPTNPGAYYVSVVGGVTMRHKTWAECEARVKGTAGARFKKVADATDEATVLAGWGVRTPR